MSAFNPSQNQVLSQVHGCRWKWCRYTFSTYPDLVQHVLSDHVRSFVPIRREDIALLKRAEEGVGDSLSFPDFSLSHSSFKDTHDPFQSSSARERTPEAPMSSLPSPPVSSPTPVSPMLYDDEPSTVSSVHHPSQRSHSTPPKGPFMASQLIIDNTNLTSPQERYSPPTFASLSSPAGSQIHEMLVDPPTPTFDSLVNKAISVNGKNKSCSTDLSFCPVDDHPSRSQDSSTSSNNSSTESSESLESSVSHVFVEQQLTQSMDIDGDTQLSAGGSYTQGQPTVSIISGAMDERMTPMPVRRQAWYGTLLPRRSSLATPLGLGVASEMQSSVTLRTSNSISSQLAEATSAFPDHQSRSGTLRFSPSVNDRPQAASEAQLHLQSQSSSYSQASELEYASYPLQTQAPYQSQSYSP